MAEADSSAGTGQDEDEEWKPAYIYKRPKQPEQQEAGKPADEKPTPLTHTDDNPPPPSSIKMNPHLDTFQPTKASVSFVSSTAGKPEALTLKPDFAALPEEKQAPRPETAPQKPPGPAQPQVRQPEQKPEPKISEPEISGQEQKPEPPAKPTQETIMASPPKEPVPEPATHAKEEPLPEIEAPMESPEAAEPINTEKLEKEAEQELATLGAVAQPPEPAPQKPPVAQPEQKGPVQPPQPAEEPQPEQQVPQHPEPPAEQKPQQPPEPPKPPEEPAPPAQEPINEEPAQKQPQKPEPPAQETVPEKPPPPIAESKEERHAAPEELKPQEPSRQKGDEVMEPMGTDDESSQYAALEAIIKAISLSSSKILLSEFKRLMSNKSVPEETKKNMMEYVYTAGLLSFSGREITPENITAVLESIEIPPNEEMVKAIVNNDTRNHLIYIYGFFYLLAVGVNPTEGSISSVVKALGFEPDGRAAAEMLRLCKNTIMEM